MTDIKFNIDGKDIVNVKVENGIKFEGVVTNVQTDGSHFIIRGIIIEPKEVNK